MLIEGRFVKCVVSVNHGYRIMCMQMCPKEFAEAMKSGGQDVDELMKKIAKLEKEANDHRLDKLKAENDLKLMKKAKEDI